MIYQDIARGQNKKMPYILIVFQEVGEELFQVKNHKDALTDVAICNGAGQAATCGDGQ